MSEHTAVKQQLEARLYELENWVERIDESLRQPNDDDWEERATELEGDEVKSALGTLGVQEIQQIHRALHQIETGTYGLCESCGARIPNARLEILPFATRCTKCA